MRRKRATGTVLGITAVILTIGFAAWAQNLNMTGQLTASGTGTHSFMGNLGVGTAAPGTRLDVGSATTDTIRSYGGFVGNAAANIGGTGAAAYFPNGAWINGGTSWIYGGILTNGSITDTSSRMAFNPAGNSWLNGGNVGIGTTSPASLLHVNGAIRAGNPTAATWANVNALTMAVDTSIYSYGAICAGNGNGTCTSSGGVTVSAGATVGTPSVALSGSGTSYFNAGNVGIGMTNPASKLDVNGTIRAGNIIGNGASCGGTTGGCLSARSGNGFSVNWNGAALQFYIDSSNVKNFIIPHPLDKSNKYLIHTTLEGPENAVFYRGTAKLNNGRAEIVLPEYFEALTTEAGRTVLVSPRFDAETESVSNLAHSAVRRGTFLVKATDANNPDQTFDWEVKAVRRDVAPLMVEPRHEEVVVHGSGPYTYYSVVKK